MTAGGVQSHLPGEVRLGQVVENRPAHRRAAVRRERRAAVRGVCCLPPTATRRLADTAYALVTPARAYPSLLPCSQATRFEPHPGRRHADAVDDAQTAAERCSQAGAARGTFVCCSRVSSFPRTQSRTACLCFASSWIAGSNKLTHCNHLALFLPPTTAAELLYA